MSSVGTKLDSNQVIKQVYDEPANRLRVDAAVSATISNVQIEDSDGDKLDINPDGSLNVNIANPMAVEIDAADGDNIAISDGTDTLAVNPDGSINVTGNVDASPSGLSIAGRITKVSINDSSWTPLPAVPLADRNGMSIQNRTGTQVFIEYDNLKPVGDGVLINTGGERFYDIKPSITIYACTASGTFDLHVEEIA
jgi:hypothetical protein